MNDTRNAAVLAAAATIYAARLPAVGPEAKPKDRGHYHPTIAAEVTDLAEEIRRKLDQSGFWQDPAVQ